MSNEKMLAVVALVAGLFSGYFYGNSSGYNLGYKTASDDDVKKALIEASKNSNPLTEVKSNPFDKAQQIINPF